MRRFHGTLDAPLLVRWAHFCVQFVDHFAQEPWRLLDLPSDDAALEALKVAQETASHGELMARLAGRVDPATAAYLAGDACRLPPAPVTR